MAIDEIVKRDELIVLTSRIKRIEYKNRLFFYMIADAMRFTRREELGRSFDGAKGK